MPRQTFLLALTLTLAGAVEALELDDYRLVDLTHVYNAETIYWPTSPTRFERETLAEGPAAGGWYYSAYSICTPEHGGTHLDAPSHFAENGATTDELPLSTLIAPAVVIDVSAQAGADRNYRLGVDDVLEFESEYGRIEEGTIVLLETGWSRHWPNVRDYLGDDTPGDASKLSFPGFGADAGRLLVEERGVAMLGVDTASIDYGSSKDYPVHQIAGAANVAGLENLANLAELPPVGATLIALPMNIGGGSGGPVRVVALVPK